MAIVSGGTDLGEITDDCPHATVTFRIGDPDFHGRQRMVEVSGEAAFAVGGTLPAHIKVAVRPPKGDAWRITNTDTGEFVEVLGGFTGGEIIELDFERELATVNDSVAALNISSDFFEVSGRAHLKVSGGTATVRWEELWL